jgi:hypothetical protein
VTKASTITVKKNTYSVPSRLIGETVQVRISERMIEVRFKGKIQLSCDRLIGEGKARIDYRHIIWTLVRKPDAFARYRHRESMFPSLVFRQAYDDLVKAYGVGRRADLSYLKLLHLSAATMAEEDGEKPWLLGNQQADWAISTYRGASHTTTTWRFEPPRCHCGEVCCRCKVDSREGTTVAVVCSVRYGRAINTYF